MLGFPCALHLMGFSLDIWMVFLSVFYEYVTGAGENFLHYFSLAPQQIE